MQVLKIVGGTATDYRSLGTAIDQGTSSGLYSAEEALGSPSTRLGASFNDVWKEIAVFQQHAKALSRTSAIFYSCLGKWKEDTEFMSSLTEMVMHPAYQRIIGLGPDVVPFILRELSDNGGHWFWAMKSLTGQDPVSQVDQGRVGRMTDAWLQWGRQHQLI